MSDTQILWLTLAIVVAVSALIHDRFRFIGHAPYAKTIYRLCGGRKYDGRKDTDYSNGIDFPDLFPCMYCD